MGAGSSRAAVEQEERRWAEEAAVQRRAQQQQQAWSSSNAHDGMQEPPDLGSGDEGGMATGSHVNQGWEGPAFATTHHQHEAKADQPDDAFWQQPQQEQLQQWATAGPSAQVPAVGDYPPASSSSMPAVGGNEGDAHAVLTVSASAAHRADGPQSFGDAGVVGQLVPEVAFLQTTVDAPPPAAVSCRRRVLILVAILVMTTVSILISIYGSGRRTGLFKWGNGIGCGGPPAALQRLSASEIGPTQASIVGLFTDGIWGAGGNAQTHIYVMLHRSLRCSVDYYNWTLIGDPDAGQVEGAEESWGSSSDFAFLLPALDGQNYTLTVFPWDATAGSGPSSSTTVIT